MSKRRKLQQLPNLAPVEFVEYEPNRYIRKTHMDLLGGARAKGAWRNPAMPVDGGTEGSKIDLPHPSIALADAWLLRCGYLEKPLELNTFQVERLANLRDRPAHRGFLGVGLWLQSPVVDPRTQQLVDDFIASGKHQVIKDDVQTDPKWKVLKRPTISAQPKAGTWAQSSRAGKAVDVTPMLARVWDQGGRIHKPRPEAKSGFRDVVPGRFVQSEDGPAYRMALAEPAIARRRPRETAMSNTADQNGKSKFWKGGGEPKALTFAKVVITRPRPLPNYDTSYVSLVKRRLKHLFKHQKEIEFDDALNGVLELMERYNDMERYDKTKSSLKTYLNHVVKDRFTDFTRSHKAANKLNVTASLNDLVGEESTTELENILLAGDDDAHRLSQVAELGLLACEILTDKETHVVSAIIEGISNNEIASTMGVSVQAISKLKLSAVDKLKNHFSNHRKANFNHVCNR